MPQNLAFHDVVVGIIEQAKRAYELPPQCRVSRYFDLKETLRLAVEYTEVHLCHDWKMYKNATFTSGWNGIYMMDRFLCIAKTSAVTQNEQGEEVRVYTLTAKTIHSDKELDTMKKFVETLFGEESDDFFLEPTSCKCLLDRIRPI